MENKTEKIKYFLYARRSSDEGSDRQVQSIDDQVNRMKALAQDYKLEIKEIYTESKSAKKPENRPVFAEMLDRIEKGEANGILCWQINRLSRNPIDSGRLGWLLQQGIIKCIQTIDKKHVPEDNVLLFNIESGQANQFIIDLSKTSQRGMEGKAERGWLPSRAPLGYKNDKLEHIIVEDPDRFTLIRKMWDLMLTGTHSPSEILRTANKDWGFRTPKSKRGGDDELASSTIYKIFTNLFYAGPFYWKGNLYQGKHKPMISIEEYDRVQVILGKKGKPRSKTHDFAYTGMIQCAECGGMYTATEKMKFILKTGEVKSFVYYHCTRRKKNIPCTQKYRLTVKELEDQIDAELQKYTILPEFFQWALEVIRSQNEKEIGERTKVYEMQHISLSKTQNELDNLTRMRYRDLIDDENYIRERDALKAKITRLQAVLRETEGRAERWLKLTEEAFDFSAHAREKFLTGSLKTKKEILNALGENFLIKDGKLSIQANEWLVPIAKSYPALEAEYKRLEPTKNKINKEQNEALASIFTRWGA